MVARLATAAHRAPPPTRRSCRSRAQVYKDFVTGEEFFSDAKDIEEVKVDGKATGLVRTKAFKQTAGGGKVDVGGGNAFGGASEEEGADDAEETKWDQFWNFPAIENQHTFSSFKEFKEAMFMPLMLAFKKHAVSKGLCRDKDEIKAKGTAMATEGAWPARTRDAVWDAAAM